MHKRVCKPKRRRRDGISYRKWDDCWYTSITGKREPLRDEHGEKIRGRSRENDAKNAFHRLALALADPAAQEGSSLLVGICLAYLQHLERESPSSLERVKPILEDLCTFVGPTLPANSLTPDLVSRWLSDRDWGQNTRRMTLNWVRCALNYGVKQMCVLAENPLRSMKLPAATSRTEVFTEKQAKQIFDAASPALSRLLQFMYRTGCRPGEACRVEAKHFVDYGKYAEFVLEPPEHKSGKKSGKTRHIAMNQELTKEIKAILAKQPRGYVFRTQRGLPWNLQNVEKQFQCLRKKLKLPPYFVPHTFRHTFATQKIDQGVPIERVATWLGDTVQVVQQTYWHALHKANKHRYTGLD